MNHPWSHCGILLPLLFHPYSLPSLPDLLPLPLSLFFRSSFAPLSLTNCECRDMIRCHSCQVKYEQSGLFSLLSGIVPAFTWSISTHHPTALHLFLPLITLEDILMIMISNEGQWIQIERIETEIEEEEEEEEEEEMNAHMWTLGQLLVQYLIIRILILFFDI